MKLFKLSLSKLVVLVFTLLSFSVIYGDHSKPQINENFKDLFNFIEIVRTQNRFPGLAVAVVKDGQVIFKMTSGYRDLKNKEPVTSRTMFYIGSCTKAFTGLACSLAAYEGLFSLKKPVIEYLPDFRLYDQHATRNLIVLDLLTHRCGLPDHEMAWFRSSRSREELYQSMRFLQPSTGIRISFIYNNLMYMIAGLLLEKMSNRSYQDFVREKILKPAQMNHSTFSLDEAIQSGNIAFPHTIAGQEIKRIDFENFNNVLPAGGLISNLDDMIKWLLIQLQNGKLNDQQVIPAKAVNLSHTPQMLIHGTAEDSELYALGWKITTYRERKPMVKHGGASSGFMALVELLPEDNMGLVLLINGSYNWMARQIIANTVKDKILGLKPVNWNQKEQVQIKAYWEDLKKIHNTFMENQIKGTQPTHSLKAYTGVFHHPGYGDLIIKMENGILTASLNHFHSILTHYHYNQFLFKNIIGASTPEFLISFIIGEQGKITSLSAPLQEGVKPIVFERKK